MWIEGKRILTELESIQPANPPPKVDARVRCKLDLKINTIPLYRYALPGLSSFGNFRNDVGQGIQKKSAFEDQPNIHLVLDFLYSEKRAETIRTLRESGMPIRDEIDQKGK